MNICLATAAACAFLTAACGVPGVSTGARPTPTDEIMPAGTVTASPAATTTPRETPSPSPTVTGPRTLTEADSGTTVILKISESVRVTLPADYHQPDASDGAVSRSGAAGGYPTGTPATATFTAVAKGNAEISSTTDYACLHASPSCALPQQQWSVEIEVV